MADKTPPIAKWLPLIVIGALLIASVLVMQPRESGTAAPAEIPYTDFKSLIDSGAVAKVVFRDRNIRADLKDLRQFGEPPRMTDKIVTRMPAFGGEKLLEELDAAKVSYSVAATEESGLRNALIGILPWVLLIGLYFWFWRRATGGMAGGLGGGAGGFGKFLQGSVGEDEETSPDKPVVTFADVAGQENAKREVAELIDFLRDPEKFRKLGAEVPHGILLVGPPGTGKTLLARALAGESGVPFFSISASEFIEVFVGVGASRVRHMFDEAKKRAPCIIFIDELDAIGRVRGAGFGGGHDEREQTLNQILSEMDGFSGHEAVIVLSATNRPDVLDPALLRPGRFDRHVTLDLPDLVAREAILKVHMKKVPLSKDVDVKTVAAGTPGFSGADLKNLVNEAAVQAARQNAAEVTALHFDEARDRIMMGSPRSLLIEKEERHRLALHESGHTILAHYLPYSDPLYKVTIIPRGRALGATHQLPEEERYTLPEEYLRDRMAVMLGGRAAEKVFLNSISSGAEDDIKQATALARAMVGRWGMSENVGPIDVRDSEEHPFLGREIAQPRRFSEATARMVDDAIRELLVEAQARAIDTIETHKDEMMRLVAALEETETLDRPQIEAILGQPHGHKAPLKRAAG